MGITFFALDTGRTQPLTQIIDKKTFSSRSLLLNLIGIVSLPSVGPGSGPNLLKKYQGHAFFPSWPHFLALLSTPLFILPQAGLV